MSARDDFQEYLKAEYSHIAEAHFKTIEAISSFFRYYLLIMSAPITIVGLFIGFADSRLFHDFRPLLVGALVVISVAGFLVMLYVTNLRMDVILYARTVNAIRKHFYDDASIGFDVKLRTRVLPQTASQPAYAEAWYFLPVVITFALLNTSYFFLALTLAGWDFEASEPAAWLDNVAWWSWFGLTLFPIHLAAYRLYANNREHSYLRSHELGVDIDGVLNTHRSHFCDILAAKTAKPRLDPNDILAIPVHECPALQVTRADEMEVFNDPAYWADMPALEGASENLKKLHNGLKIRVRIFTHRPWPDLTHCNSQERSLLAAAWFRKASSLVDAAHGTSSLRGMIKKMRLKIWLLANAEQGSISRAIPSAVLRKVETCLATSPIDEITVLWLSQFGFKYNAITVERGNENVSDPQGHLRNRFYITRKSRTKFFVEDDWEKATKLAYICDVVFLADQPYNRPSGEHSRSAQSLPNNVIRVKTWDEIYRHIRRLS